MTDLFNFHVNRFPQKASESLVKARAIVLFTDKDLSSSLDKIRKLAADCRVEEALQAALRLAKKHLEDFENRDERIASLEQARQDKAEQEAEEKRAKLQGEIDSAGSKVEGLARQISELEPQKHQDEIATLKRKVARLKEAIAKLRRELRGVVPTPARKSKRHRTLEAVAVIAGAAEPVSDICVPAGRVAVRSYLAANESPIEDFYSGDGEALAREFFAEFLIALAVLKKSTDPALPDARHHLRTLVAMRAIVAELQATRGGVETLKLAGACEAVRRPIVMPGWVRSIDPCCNGQDNTAGEDGRLLDAQPFRKLQMVRDYRQDLAEVEECKRKRDAAEVAARQAKDRAATDPEGDPHDHGAEHDCGCDCECSCDDCCMPQNPCCVELNSYVTDLMTVRQRPLCYEPGELAHIHNKMAGESLVRVHESVKETEDYSEQETTTTKSEENDYQSSERFELQEASKKTLSQDFAADAGITTSGKYGAPGNKVAVTASANVSYAQSKTQAQQTAQNFAKDVTQRSVMKIQEETRSLTSRRVLRRVTETNTHSFDSAGSHMSAQFYWVNKISEAQVMNWGKRMMYEFVIPEPAALYKELMRRRAATAAKKEARLPRPPKPDLVPTDITEDNYHEYVAEYGLTGVAPLAIPKTTTVSVRLQKDFDTDGKGNDECFHAADLTIPPDYLGVRFTVSGGIEWGDGATSSTVVVGPRYSTVLHDDYGFPPKNLPDIEGAVPITFTGWGLAYVSANVNIECERKPSVLADWQMSIFDKIMSEYRRKLADYELQQDAMEESSLVEIKGRNAFLNRELERNEIKRLVISIISCQHFDRFQAMVDKVVPCGHPQLDFRRAKEEGAFIQFFEQAFEWDQMMYLFYPYFWGKKCSWEDRITSDTGDALFDKFVCAGAVRAQAPVRPEFVLQMQHYEQTGEIWLGDGEPDYDVTAPHYLAMHEEFRNQTGNYQQSRPGLLDVEFDLFDEAGNALTPEPDQVMIKGTDFYWDWAGLQDPAYPDDEGGLDFTAIANDIDREIMIGRKSYRIVSIELYRGNDGNGAHTPTDPAQQGDPAFIKDLRWVITLDRAVELRDDDPRENWKYAVGAIYVEAPWEVTTPSSLVWLRPEGDDGYGKCLPCDLPVEC